MIIDPHVHCRDGKQSYKETIEHALKIASLAGYTALFDMPNTDPPLVDGYDVSERIRDAAKIGSNVAYGLHIGVTLDAEQLITAVGSFFEKSLERRLHENKGNTGVVGLKMYAGSSVGDLKITEEGHQRTVYYILANEGYNGVLVLHCEKESLMKPKLWNPEKPETHSLARPREAEFESIKDQIEFASEYNFQGHLHIAHVSVPESVEFINEMREGCYFKISCGVTPHHLFLNTDIQAALPPEQGRLYKVNPPLRTAEDNKKLLEYLKAGDIDWIETDHAPHTLQEKINTPYMSGFPGIPSMPHVIMKLRKLGFNAGQIKDLTFNNVNKIYGLSLEPLDVFPFYDLHNQYEVDVHAPLREQWNLEKKEQK